MKEDKQAAMDDRRSPMHVSESFNERSKVSALIALSIALCLPFLNQAFHIDDPTFLALADHSWPNPLDLYSFEINWLGIGQPAFEILSNPPFVPWYLAGANSVAHGKEWVFHAAFLPFLALALHGIYRLAKRFSPSGSARVVWWAVCSPALVVASHSIMPDLPLLAFLSLGIAIAIEGVDRQQPGRAFLGSLLAGLSSLCRYSGGAVTVLMLLYVMLKRARPRFGLIVLSGSLIPISLWTAASVCHYGRIHWAAIAGFQGRALEIDPLVQKTLYQVTALSLALALPAVLRILSGTGLPEIAKAGLLTGAVSGLLLGTILRLQLVAIGFLAFGLAAGLVILALAFQHASAIPKLVKTSAGGADLADSVFLSLWLLGIFAFNLSLLFAAVRYLLPALPPALLLLDRSLPARSNPRTIIAGAIALSVSLMLAQSDRRLAAGYREYAATLPAATQERWFLGHWGLQYYLEKTGAKALDLSRPGLVCPGDEIIFPGYAAPNPLPPSVRSSKIETTQINAPIGFRTVTADAWACFHSNVIAHGPTIVGLPFGLNAGPLDTITRVRVIP